MSTPLRHLTAWMAAMCLSWLIAGAGLPHECATEGTLLFVLPHKANAITQATGEADHVAIVHRIGGAQGPLYVIEAVAQGVCLTPLDSFLVRNADADIIVKQVPGLDAPRSVRNALRLAGRPYDWNYTLGDSALYCSELVQMSYVDCHGKPVFGTVPMQFSGQDGGILPYWREHYGRQGLKVPEGEPGTNPTQLLKQLNASTQ